MLNTSTPQMTAWLSHAAGQSRPPCSCPRPLRLASAQAAAAPHGGARAAANALCRAHLRERRHLPSLHLTTSPARPACSAGAGRHRSMAEGLPRQQLAAAHAQAAASCKASMSAPALPEYSLLRRARGRCRRRSRPHMHSTQLLRRPGLPPPSAGWPRRLCALQLCPEPLPLATARPHGRRAAAAQGSLRARACRTRCMLGRSPAHARRAGRMLALLCTETQRRAPPSRR